MNPKSTIFQGNCVGTFKFDEVFQSGMFQIEGQENLIATWNCDSEINILSYPKWEKKVIFKEKHEYICSLIQHEINGTKVLISVSEKDMTLKIWNIQTGDLLKTITSKNELGFSGLTRIPWGKNKTTVVVSMYKNLQVLELETEVVSKEIEEAHEGRIYGLATITKGGNVKLLTAGDTCVKVWDMKNEMLLEHKIMIGSETCRIVPIVSKEIVAVANVNNEVCLFNWNNWTPIQILRGHTDIPWQIITIKLENEDVLVTGGQDTFLKFWEMGSWNCFKSIEIVNEGIGSLFQLRTSTDELILVTVHFNLIKEWR